MESPDRPAPPQKTTAYEIASWIFMATGIVFALYRHLLSALLAGLFVYALTHRIAAQLFRYKLGHNYRKLVAAGLAIAALIGISAVVILAFIGLVRGHVGGLPELVEEVTKIVAHFRVWFTEHGIGWVIPSPERIDEIVKTQTEHLNRVRGDSPKMVLHAIVGIAIGSLLSFHSGVGGGPLANAFFERARRFSAAFENVFFAQVKISALNTVFTLVYLSILLPIWGVNLPLRGTLILVTFIAGLLPVIGNLISNAAIVLISLGVSPSVAGASLAFLVVIHKLEYFLNAKIVGGQIKAAAWEILLAMLCFDAAFGVQGVILAPIAYAYVKGELMDRGLI